MTTIKPHVTRFYQVLPLMGINMANQPYTVPQRVNDAINAIEDVPEEWWEHMIEFGREYGVKDPMKVITGLEKWTADGGPPALRQAKAAASNDDRSDERIVQWAVWTQQNACCECDDIHCLAWHSDQLNALRFGMPVRVVEARKQQTGVA